MMKSKVYMIFNNMTRQEIQFYNFLINEYTQCNNSSYLNILYDVIPYDNKIHEDTLYQLLDTTYDHKTHILLHNYQNICKNNGCIFDINWKYDETKAEEFDRIIEKLK